MNRGQESTPVTYSPTTMKKSQLDTKNRHDLNIKAKEAFETVANDPELVEALFSAIDGVKEQGIKEQAKSSNHVLPPNAVKNKGAPRKRRLKSSIEKPKKKN